MKKLLLFVGMIFSLLTISFTMQAIIVSKDAARLVGVGIAVSGCAMSLLPNELKYVLAIAGSGFVLGGMSYWGIREYTPDQILHRADQAEKEMRKSKIGCLFDMSQKVTLEAISGISKYPCIDAMDEAKIQEENLQKHIEYLALAKKYGDSLKYTFDSDEAKKYRKIENTKTFFNDHIKRIHVIRSIINSEANRANYNNERQCHKEDKGLLLEEKKVDNEENQTNVKKIEANARFYAVVLKYYKWVLGVVIMAPILLRIFAWSSKLPYPY
jgi:hypothetical protein